MILYINACVRSDSRTKLLADHLLSKFEGDIREVRLADVKFADVDEAYLAKRDSLAAAKDHSADMFSLARDFAAADEIIIAAPFWDLSFPASLKQYFEHINVIGLTFDYNDKGEPVGLCAAKKLYYVTTAGGKIFNEEYGFGYVRALAETFYGISNCVMFKAECLDIYGADTAAILEKAKSEIDEHTGHN